jgi:hypothetical protein
MIIAMVIPIGMCVTQIFQTYYKNLSGLLFCRGQADSSSSGLGVCLQARADDETSIGVYSVSLSTEERAFLSNFLQALGWRLLHADKKGEEVFAQWRCVLVFGKLSGGQENALDCLDQSGEVVACEAPGQEKNFVFLPALGDIMHSGALKKRVWDALKSK